MGRAPWQRGISRCPSKSDRRLLAPCSVLSQILHITVPVFAVALLGFLYGRLGRGDMEAANQVNMGLFVPALLFYVLSEKVPNLSGVTDMALGALIIVIGSGLLALPLARITGVPPRALLPSLMFRNGGNLGLPLAALAFGEDKLPLAVIAFVVSASLHFSLGIWYLSDRLNPLDLLRNPVVLATGAGIGCNLLSLHTPQILMPSLEMLSAVSVPLLLVALGVRLGSIDLSYWRVGLLAAILAPVTGLLCAAAAIGLLDLDTDAAKALLLFGALPPAVLNYLMAERFARFPDQVASIVAVGNLFALVSIPAILVFIL